MTAPLPAEDRSVGGLDVDALYREHGVFVGRLLLRLCGDTHVVDDLLQETFIAAFKGRDAFAGRSSERTWLCGIALNVYKKHLRSRQRFDLFRARLTREPTVSREPLPCEHAERQETVTRVAEVIGKMPLKQREVFVLYELQSLEGSEIAELLGIPVATVWTRLHQARKSFRKMMDRRMKARRLG